MTENIQETEQEKNLAVVVTDDNIAQVSVSLEEVELEPYQKQYLIEKRKNVVIRGFRKGKAPEAMVAKFFKEEARQSAKSNLIYNKYMKLLEEHRLRPLAVPKVENMKDEEGKIDAKITVEVLQPVVLGQYLGLEIQSMPSKSIEDGVNKTLAEIRHNYPKLIDLPLDTPAQDGNVVLVDFSMLDDGKQLEKQENFKVILGTGLYFKDFEENIKGQKAGDTKEFDIQFPETYQRNELKNKNIRFTLTVKLVQNVTNYTDEELAKLLGYETTEKMIELLTKEVESKIKTDERVYYENQILGQLLTSHQFKVPKTLIDEEIKRISREKPDMPQEQVQNVAERFIKTDLILRAIYERHPDIQFKQDEFNAKVAELATKANDTVEATIEKLRAAGKLDLYVNFLTSCKVVDFIIEMADKKESLPPTVIINENNNVVQETIKEKENG